MRILLFEPPFLRLKGRRTVFFPLGPGYLAAALAEHGHEVLIHNCELMTEPPMAAGDGRGSYATLFAEHHRYRDALTGDDHPVWREVREEIARHAPEIVGITVRSAKLPAALRIATIAKRTAPGCRVVLGGPHPTIASAECAAAPDVDVVVRGEGEVTFAEICETLATGGDLAHVAGTTFRQDGEIVETPPRPLIESLDTLPFPARKLVTQPDRYPPGAMGVVTTSRGCPFRCGYCSAASVWTRRVRYRSVENVLTELETIRRDHGVRDVTFWDDSFTVNRRRIIALCRGLRERRLGLRWLCTTRVDLLDDEVLAAMRRAGCVRIDLGIETGSERMLALIDKGTDLAAVRRGVALIRRHGIEVGAFFMVGFPDETVADVRASIDLMRELPASSLCLSVFTPYPGSAQFDRAHELGLIPDDLAWEEFDHQSPRNFFVKNIERTEFDTLVTEMIAVVDDRRRRGGLTRRLRRLRTHGRYYLENPDQLVRKAAARVMRA